MFISTRNLKRLSIGYVFQIKNYPLSKYPEWKVDMYEPISF